MNMQMSPASIHSQQLGLPDPLTQLW